MTAPRRLSPEGDRGSLALELTLVAPAFFLMIALILAYGRYASVSSLTEAAARDAARAATQARSLDDAQARVDAVTADTLKGTPPSCRDTGEGRIVDTTFAPGEFLTVQVSCQVGYSDLGLPGTGAAKKITRTFVSPLDLFRPVAP